MPTTQTAGASLAPLVVVMLISGTCNTLLMKYLCRQQAPTGPGEPVSNFDFPFFQTLLMMIGEFMCLAVFAVQPAESKALPKAFKPWVMLIPVSCDWTATTLVNAAYMMIPASTIQMCRGCVVMFTCLFSVVFLGRKQQPFHYFGVALAALGITIVSLEAILYGKVEDTTVAVSAAWVGICLCVFGQIFQASMMVVEEKLMGSFSVPPLQMVGLEGLFGCAIGVVLLGFLQRTGFEKTTDAMYMMQHSHGILFGSIASMFSIAFFNWSGVTVTQNSSATSRATIDVCRTALIWVAELYLAWNTFSSLQLIGFVVLIIGTLIYNEVLSMPFAACGSKTKASFEEEQPLVDRNTGESA